LLSAVKPKFGQFHQHFTNSFFIEQIPQVQKDTDDLTVVLHFYEQLKHAQIPKVQKYSQPVSIFTLLESACVKAAGKTLVK